MQGLDLSVTQGTVFGLLGANGAGKSTTIECMLGTTKPDTGTVSILGMNPLLQRKRLFENVGVQFQEANYQDKVTVAELCEVTQSLYRNATDYGELLEQFGISEKEKSMVKELSGGQRQKLSFMEQSFGILGTIAICAGGVMGLPLVVSDYRSKKILKRFKVTPVSPAMILAVQVVIYTIYSVASFILLYIVSALFFGFHMGGSTLAFLGGYLSVMLSIFSIGMMVGGISPNSQTASMIASLLYFPMLIFSGATLPYEVMPSALQKIADFLPLTQGIKLLKAASLGLPIENALVPIIVMAALAVICFGVSFRFFKWE